MKSKMLCILIAVFLLCACNEYAENKTELLSEVEKINLRHSYETKLIPNINIKDYTSSIPSYTEISEDELDSLTSYSSVCVDSNPIEYEKAVEDIELMFRILKNCYAAYDYFGGDKAFEEAKKQVLSECKASGDKLKSGHLKESLINNLEFIKDGHFSVNGCVTFKKARYYSNDETDFLKDEKGYFMTNEEQKIYVHSIDGDGEIDKYMKRSISDEGSLVYRLGILSFEEHDFLEVNFEDKSITLSLFLPEKLRTNINFSSENIDNIPVVAIRSFLDNESSEQFVKTAQMLKDSPVAILDLRDNRGGWLNYVKEWLNVYAPELSEYYLGNIRAILHTRAVQYLNSIRYKANIPEKDEKLAEEYSKLYKLRRRNQWEIHELPAIKQVKNDNILFVIFDENTFSSGEIMAAILRKVENVIFIGSNTKGGLLSDNSIKIVLPNSKINIVCSLGMWFFYDETIVSDEKGLEPDIWVRGDSLESVLNMILYYNLS